MPFDSDVHVQLELIRLVGDDPGLGPKRHVLVPPRHQRDCEIHRAGVVPLFTQRVHPGEFGDERIGRHGLDALEERLALDHKVDIVRLALTRVVPFPCLGADLALQSCMAVRGDAVRGRGNSGNRVSVREKKKVCARAMRIRPAAFVFDASVDTGLILFYVRSQRRYTAPRRSVCMPPC
jgi:hypothetical protein